MIKRNFFKKWVPPGVINSIRILKAHLIYADWEYMPQGWNYSSKKVKGWNLDSIADLQVKKWARYCNAIEGTSPLFVNHEAADYSQPDLISHNTYMCFSYACAMAACGCYPFRLLDWGGGIGHYGKVAESVLPGTAIKYTCYDMPVFCERGQKVYPEAEFVDNIDKVLEKSYDLTLLSSSLWYDPNWRDTLNKLINVTQGYLLITRMIFINNASSYIAIQRPYSMGYKTEYLCQIFNKKEIIDFVVQRGFTLIKEMFLSDAMPIYKAPEQGKYGGFLFKKNLVI
ncbi:MAG: hypothetical protein V4592_09990 [Bacteroidota bacterium]